MSSDNLLCLINCVDMEACQCTMFLVHHPHHPLVATIYSKSYIYHVQLLKCKIIFTNQANKIVNTFNVRKIRVQPQNCIIAQRLSFSCVFYNNYYIIKNIKTFLISISISKSACQKITARKTSITIIFIHYKIAAIPPSSLSSC